MTGLSQTGYQGPAVVVGPRAQGFSPAVVLNPEHQHHVQAKRLSELNCIGPLNQHDSIFFYHQISLTHTVRCYHP